MGSGFMGRDHAAGDSEKPAAIKSPDDYGNSGYDPDKKFF